jgi:hypothetical protein
VRCDPGLSESVRCDRRTAARGTWPAASVGKPRAARDSRQDAAVSRPHVPCRFGASGKRRSRAGTGPGWVGRFEQVSGQEVLAFKEQWVSRFASTRRPTPAYARAARCSPPPWRALSACRSEDPLQRRRNGCGLSVLFGSSYLCLAASPRGLFPQIASPGCFRWHSHYP